MILKNQNVKKRKSIRILAVIIPLAIALTGMSAVSATDNIDQPQEKSYSTENIIDYVWNNYDVQSTQIGGEDTGKEVDPTIWIDVYNESQIPEIEAYLKSHLSEDDLDYYKIDVSPYGGDDV